MVNLEVINSDEISEKTISTILGRNKLEATTIISEVEGIIECVRTRGDKALLHYTEKFDHVKIEVTELSVSNSEFEIARKIMDTKVMDAIEYGKNNLINFHKNQIRHDWFAKEEDGMVLGQVHRPLNTIGVYIPGGKATYISTVLHAIVPAYIAGVANILLCTPPRKDKTIAPEIIVTAHELGVRKIFRVGGAQAIAALAHGTESIPKVQKIVGPGNVYVNVAKSLLSNVVPIDVPAGPSEVLIVGDDFTNHHYIILDLLSQIEHDSNNIGLIVTHSDSLIDKILNEINSYIMKSKRKEIIESALNNNSKIIRTKNITDSIRISNLIAPEHLQLMTKNPKDLLPEIHNAGAIFLGEKTPSALGDYCAGTNHILPTAGTATSFSGLNVNQFIKIIDVLECKDPKRMKRSLECSARLAKFEGLWAHYDSLVERIGE